MADRRAKYKQKGDNFGDFESSRINRIEKQDQRRKNIRSQNFSRLRHLNETTVSQSAKAPVISRNERLQKWKQQKELKKKSEKKVVKPPFKVGVVHHRVFSPPFSNSSIPSCSHWNVNSISKLKTEPSTPTVKKITRVTEKRLAAKAAAKALAETLNKKSFAPPNHKFKPPEGLPNIPLFGRIKKGSIGASDFSWNSPMKSEVKKSRASLRKSSISSSLSSTRRSKKFKVEPSEQEVTKTPQEVKVSNSSGNSLFLRDPSDCSEVFNSPIQKSPINEENGEKQLNFEETFTHFSHSLEKNKISSIISNDDLLPQPLKSITAEKDDLQFNLSKIESVSKSDLEGDSFKLQVTDLSDKEGNSSTMALFKTETVSKSDLESDSFKLQVTDLSDKEGNSSTMSLSNTETVSKSDLASDSFKLQLTDLSDKEGNSLKSIDQAAKLLPQSESEKVDCLLTDISEKSFDETLNLAIFSPYVVTRRGKKEARKEQQLRRGFHHSPEEIPTKETIMQTLNISIEEEKRTAQYFKCLLESETNRLSEKCDHWNDIIEKENPPEEAKEIVEQAIGQTKLLLRSKFNQFAGLVRQCEEGAGDHLVTCKDLQGFWDMMNVTVKNCENRFQKVVELKTRGWKEEDDGEDKVQRVKIKKVPARKKLPSNKKSPAKKSPAKKSSLRAMIMAKRQKMKNTKVDSEAEYNESSTTITTSNRRLSIALENSTSKEKRISFSEAPENKFSTYRTILKTQEEVENEKSTEMETINVHVLLDESIIYINSEQTPGKSILKRIKVENNADDSRLLKSTQKVNFNDNVEMNEIETDETAKASKRLVTDRINSTDFEDECVPEVSIRAEKRLNFEDMSFNEIANDSLTEEDDHVFQETTHNMLQLSKLNVNSLSPEVSGMNDNSKSTLDLQNSKVEETDQNKYKWKSPRLNKMNEMIPNFENSHTKKDKENKFTPKSPKSTKKAKMNLVLENSVSFKENQTDVDEEINQKKYIWKSPRLNTSSKITVDLDNSIAEEIRQIKNIWKSPRLAKGTKETPDLKNSIVEKIKEKKLTPKSPRSTKKSKKINLDLDHSVTTEETQEKSDEIEQKKNTWKSPRLTKKNKKINLDLDHSVTMEETQVEEDYQVKQKKHTPKSPRSTKKSKINLDLGNSILTEETQVDEDAMFSRSLRNRTITGNLTPRSAKKINNSGTGLTQIESPASSKSLFKMRRSPKRKSDVNEKSDNEIEEQIYKKFQKMRLDKSTSEKSMLTQTKSPGTKKNNLRSANKLLTEELLDGENSSNLETENLTDLFEKGNVSLKKDFKKKVNTKNILTEKNKNYKDFLNTSLKESKISKPKTPRRSIGILENKLLGEKENASPGLYKSETFKNQNITDLLNSPKVSPKPIETPSKRKSIKRSMSCHVAECQIDFSTPQLQRSNSTKSTKSRRSMNPASFTKT